MSARIDQSKRKSRDGTVSGRLLCTTSLSALVLLAHAAAFCAPAAAQTWTGNGTDGDWSNAANWTPGAPASDPTTNLVFGTNGNGFDPSNDTNDFILNVLTVNDGFTQTITGQSLIMRGSNPNITMNSNDDITITNDIAFIDDGAGFQGIFVTGSGTGNLILSGDLSQLENNSRFRTNVGVTVTLSGTNSYTGFTDLFAGSTLIAANNFALGAAIGGTSVVNTATLALQGNIDLQEQAITLVGSGVGDAGALRNLSGNNAVLGAITLGGATRIQSDADTLTLSGGIGGAQNLTFGGAGSIVVDSAIATGTGSVTIEGTTTFSGANTYSGGTFLNDGVLSVSADSNLGDAAGALTFDGGALQNTAAFTSARQVTLNAGGGAFQTDADLTLSGVIDGAGELAKTGTDSLILTGDNTYAGGTTITAGTLQLGDGGATGSIDGDVVNNGELAFNHSVTTTFGGLISGSGDLTKLGADTLILTADNTYTGGTTVTAGTLQIGDGGGTGSIAGDVLNSAALVFNRSGTLTMNGLVSGSGTVTQAGPGTTVLTSANSYAGATDVNAGTLLINGDQSGATGLTTVFNGASLGGSGVVGGSVLVENGGTLSPGNSPGVLTVNGDLFLNDGSVLDFEFGQANVPGGPLNDLIDVLGDLTLDGTLNVTQSAGGNFGPGVYRVINYAGALTDNGATVGTLPGGATGFIQTAVVNEVNLVNTAGLTLSFWDGAAGPKNDSLIQGGDGIWRVGGGENNWTTSDGSVNADYAQDSMAVFQAAGGIVTVDNSGGNVLTSGMQFTADGYTIAGDPLTLTGAQALVRTGDGSPADGGITTTIDAALTGSAGLVKTDAGTLVLNGTNSYSGGTTISGGTLRISSDANLGAAAGGLSFDGGTLNTTASFDTARPINLAGAGTFLTDGGTTLTLNGAIAGAGALVKSGAGSLVLTTANSYTGGTQIDAGTLRISSDANLGDAAGGLGFNGGVLNTTADIGSSRAVDLIGAGTVLTDAATTLTLNGAITGSGGITKVGAGSLVLTGANSYAGDTNVAAGTLFVNGDQSAATGVMNVASGATLGGAGVIGGNVTLADGAALAAGTNAVGTLTIDGNLALGGGSVLDFEFGAANIAGGALNDLVNVGGDLTLDGTINVSESAGGSFGPGIYRVFNYGGSLTDNGLALGTLPGGSAVTVQTSVAGQVNLVNAAGLTLSFWDGNAGPKNNNMVDGGSGVWSIGGGSDNWTDASGAVNADYAQDSFAIFSAAPGTVTVDNGGGNVLTSGMQFASDGYVIVGDPLTLTGTQAIVQVGDGSVAGAGFTATIDAELTGSAGLVKTDAGTLVLNGTNSYSGGTTISGGTLRISSDANLGAAAGAISLDGGTLATSDDMSSARDIVIANSGAISTASGTMFTYDGLLSGAGALTKAGAGTLLLTGDNSGFAGSTQVEGTLAVNGSLCGDVNVAANGRLQGTGTVCTTNNAGTVAPGNSIGTLTVAGDYTGTDGTLEIEAELGGDASPTDRLVVTGNTSGSTAVTVINQGGLGAQTVEGIKIVDVTGGTSAGTFTLNGDYDFEGTPAVIAGAYGYQLFQGGVSTPADGDWYLRSTLLDGSSEPQGPLYQPGVPLYEGYAGTLQTLNGLSTLQERVGNRRWSGFTQGGIGMWGRIEGARQRPDAVVSTSGTDVDTDMWGLQFGFDAAVADVDAGVLIAGVNGRYGTAEARVRSQFGNGEIDTTRFGMGATLTWYGTSGFYADAQAQLSWFDSDLDSTTLGSLVSGSDGSGEAFSLEVGQRLSLGDSLSLTPQAQIVYSDVRFDAFVDPHDAMVSAEDSDSLRGRVGFSLDHEHSWTSSNGETSRNHVYGIVNLEYEMLDGTRIEVSGTPLVRRDHRLWGEFGLGVSHSWSDDQFTVFSEVSVHSALADFGSDNGLRANAGFRMKF